MTAPVSVRFEFSYTVIATNTPKGFALAGEVANGITEDIAHGIRTGLQTVPTITDVTAREILETEDSVTVPLWAT
jgi:hypothetical protein